MRNASKRSAWLAAALSIVQIVVSTCAYVALSAAPAAAAATCATPGNDGVGSPNGIVNTYFAPSSNTVLAAGATSVSLGPHAAGDANIAIAPGDMLLIVQIQDATISTGNSSTYGNGSSGSGETSLGSSGQYEYVVATSSVPTGGGTLTFTGGGGAGALNTYTEASANSLTGQETFEIVRVPQYSTATLNSGFTALPWNGSAGGIAAIDVQGTLNLNSATVSVNGEGFRGGGTMVGSGGAGLTSTDYATSSSLAANGAKGEGLAGTPLFTFNGTSQGSGSDYPGGGMGRGAPSTAGGGATDGDPVNNDNNSGGGGGANSGNGGVGGESNNSQLAVGGLGGTGLGAAVTSLIFLGGGGGAGSSNDGTLPPNGSSGGTGGGIIFLRVGGTSGSATFNSNGSDGQDADTDGAGGGGAGGTVVVSSPATYGGVTVNVLGGDGGSTSASLSNVKANKYGPGGSGGGGFVLTSTSTTRTMTAGNHGSSTSGAIAFGAGKGTGGAYLKITASNIPGVVSGAECSSTGSGANAVYVGPYDPNDATYGGAYYTGSYDGIQLVSNNNDFIAVAIPLAGTTLKNLGTVPGTVVGNALTLSTAAQVNVPSEIYDDQTGGTARTVTVTVTAPSGWTAQLCRDDGTGIACGTYDTNHSSCNSGLYTGWANTMPTSPAATSTGTFCVPSTNGVYKEKFWVQYNTATSLTAFQRYDAPITAQDNQATPASNTTHDELYAGYVALTKSKTILNTGCPAGETPAASGVCPGGVIVYSIDYRNIMAGGGTGTEAAAATAANLYLVTSPGSLNIVEDGGAAGNTWGVNTNGLTVGLTIASSFPNCGVLTPTAGACGDTTTGSLFTYDAGHPSGVGATMFTDQVGGAAFQLFAPGVAGEVNQGTVTFAVQVK